MTLFRGYGFFASSLSGAAPGMVLIKPTSIAHSGTSATLGANGQVTFSAVTSLSLNGCFTADFDNYVISVRGVCNTSNVDVRVRMRASGTDNTTANSYTHQRIQASSTTVNAQRVTEDSAIVSGIGSEQRSGFWLNLYGPFLAQPTAGRGVMVDGTSGARILEYAFTHNQSTSYDGFTMYPGANNISGALQVYGVRS